MAKKKETKKFELKEVSRVEINGPGTFLSQFGTMTNASN